MDILLFVGACIYCGILRTVNYLSLLEQCPYIFSSRLAVNDRRGVRAANKLPNKVLVIYIVR